MCRSVEDEGGRRRGRDGGVGRHPPASVLIFALWKTRRWGESTRLVGGGGGAGKTNGERNQEVWGGKAR